MKPISASEILRRNAPRDTIGSSFLHVNRWETFRDISPAPTERSRLDSNASQKRKEWDRDKDDCEEVSKKTKVCTANEEEELQFALLESRVSKVSTTCGSLVTKIQQLEIDDSLRVILAEIVGSVRETNAIQEELVSRHKGMRLHTVENSVDTGEKSGALSYADKVSGKSSAAQRRKPLTGGLVGVSADGRGKLIPQIAKPVVETETEEEKLIRKFSDSIRDAERSTLCFNLDMGNVPLMNKTTIAEKASLALTKMAAKKEGKRNSVPSQDAVATIDDLTSLVTNMDFFGANTKQYKGKDSSGFCTIPVKYQFKDRDQRVYAERKLRDVCGVKCATPYPAIVRECIKQVVDHVRTTHKEDFVRVSVVAKEFALKVSRRPPGKDLPWVDYPDLLRLPDEAWDVSAKKVPAGLRMLYLPSENNGNDDMLTSPSRSEKSKKQVSPSKTRRGSSELK
jgi:hypothetical protein